MNTKQISLLLSLILIVFSGCGTKSPSEKHLFDKEPELVQFLKINQLEVINDTILLLPTNICLTCNLPYQFIIDTLPNLTILVGNGLEKYVSLKYKNQKLLLFEVDELPRFGLLKYYPEVFIFRNKKIFKYYPITKTKSLNPILIPFE